MKEFTLPINKTSIETGLWHIQCHLMMKYGTDQAYHDMLPLHWYINSGRASIDFLRLLLGAKPYMVARKLHQGGSDQAVIDRIKSYLGYEATL